MEEKSVILGTPNESSVFVAERKVTAEFRAICQKLCENFAFPKSFHTKKLGEISVYHAMKDSVFTKKL